MAYKAETENGLYNPGFMCPTGQLSKTYDPNLTNNLANFIYSQIIYNDKDSRKMLKDYLIKMATYTPNGIESFSNIEGFSSNSMNYSRIEGFTKDDLDNAIETNNNNIVQTTKYENKLGSISRNSKYLQNYINKNSQYQRDITDIGRDGKSDFYDFSGNLLYYNDKDIPSLRDTRIRDNQEFIIQQNTVYIIGTITCATMIIAAIILGRQ